MTSDMKGRMALGKNSLPHPIRVGYNWANSAVGRFDAKQRTLPNFLVVGTQRGGTTSLFAYLLRHELIFGPRRSKGVHYFDTHYRRDALWYRAHFPRRSSIERLANLHGVTPAVGEGSPYYMFHPTIAARVAELMPECRIVMVLREPLDRAMSHHNHEVKRGFETLSLVEAFDAESARLAGELVRLTSDPTYVSKEHVHHAYIGRSQYADQIERFSKLFGRDRVLVLDSAMLKSDPESSVRRVTEFLGLPAIAGGDYPLYNQRERDPVSPELRERYGHLFDESNEQLRQLLLPGELSWL